MSAATDSTRRVMLSLIALGFIARLFLFSVSWGSYDALIYERLGAQVARIGLDDTYRFEGDMNHPPLAGLWMAIASRAGRASGIAFHFLFKIPSLLGDVLTCWLLFKSWSARGDGRAGLPAAALFAWNLAAILLSAHHCSCDSFYAALCVASLYFAEIRNRPFIAALLLGAALNVKLLPAILLIPMLLLSRSRREFVSMLAGLVIAALPFEFMLLHLGYRFRMRVLQYRGVPGGWGFHDLLDLAAGRSQHPGYFRTVADQFAARGSMLVFALILLATLALRRRLIRDRAMGCAIAVAMFAAFTPAFAMQYSALVGAMLFVWNFRAGAIWGLLSGAALLTTYYFSWTGRTFPIRSFDRVSPPGAFYYMPVFAWAFALALSIFFARWIRNYSR